MIPARASKRLAPGRSTSSTSMATVAGYPAPPGRQLPRETVEERRRRRVQRPQLDRRDQAGQRPDREERDSPLAGHLTKATAAPVRRQLGPLRDAGSEAGNAANGDRLLERGGLPPSTATCKTERR